MSDIDDPAPLLGGAVDNGRRGVAAFDFYNGVVGVRDRGASLELAYFGEAVAIALPADGLIDGVGVRVIEIDQRKLGASLLKPRAASPMLAIVLTVVPIAS